MYAVEGILDALPISATRDRKQMENRPLLGGANSKQKGVEL